MSDTPIVQVWDGAAACRGCRTGAIRAGRAVDYHPLRDAMKYRCEICGRVGDRLIEGRHDISCRNRLYEALANPPRNARGSRPRLAEQLRTISVTVVNETAVSIEEFTHARSMFEVILRAARTATGESIAISRPVMRVIIPPDAEAA